jgi:hypothetical protein
MHTRVLSALVAAGLAAGQAILAADSPPAHFITAHDGKLFDGEREFRFISFNIPNLLEIEDNVGFTNGNPWRLPDRFEINDALETVRQLGGTVVRTYAITVERTNDTPEIPRHVLAPGKFNESAFRALDEVLAAANRTGIRLIIPLVDNWPWMGGRAEYARWRGQSKNQFWTDPQLVADFEQTIQFILARTNTVTGVVYRDDPAILCWETGNELSAPPPSWTREIARCLKAADPHHLVMDGLNGSELHAESLAIPDVDIVTTHLYPGKHPPFAEMIRASAELARGRKAYVVGEFGFVGTAEMLAALDEIDRSGASGGLLWSLRFRNRDGGFYWHSEPYGGDLFKAFHWPPSALGEPYDEAKLMNAVRAKAYAIRGLPTPALPIPAPPRLLPVTDAAAIAWQGSVGASGYQVERARKISGDWQIVATNVDEAFTQYRPEFADENVPAGKWCYRVRARNESGLSEPSNVAGPVKVRSATLVDELADFSRAQIHAGTWQLANRNCRSAKEDAHRAAGLAGDTLVYQLPSTIQSFRVFALFPKAESAVKFSVSTDGTRFREVPAQKDSYFQGAGEYGYWQPVCYHADKLRGGAWLKIELTGATQLGRIEITHAAQN